jgi:hypothetical protein
LPTSIPAHPVSPKYIVFLSTIVFFVKSFS